MAKRKRLEPARGMPPPLETKSMGGSTGIRPPIADVAQDAASHAAFDAVTRELTDARENGRLIQALPLDAIDDGYLVRDRLRDHADTDDMDMLIASLRARGQQTAIEVTEIGHGHYGLISGWRRLTALRQIAAENAGTDTVLALVRRPEDMAHAYQAMVDENEIRAALSFYERARIVVKARDSGVFATTRDALTHLFGTVPRARRSKINSFVGVVDAFDAHLRFPTAITERLGLAMAKALDRDPDFAARLKTALTEPAATATDEVQVIQGALTGTPAPAKPASKPETVYIRDGLSMTVHPKGRVVLEGERMREPHMLKALRRALDTL